MLKQLSNDVLVDRKEMYDDFHLCERKYGYSIIEHEEESLLNFDRERCTPNKRVRNVKVNRGKAARQ